MMLQHLFSDLYSYLSHLALCPSFYSVLSRSFYNSYTIFSLPVNPTSLYLKPKSSQLDALLRASKWQKTVIDTVLPVISPVGLLRLLYDGQADLAGTERGINKEDPLKSEERSCMGLKELVWSHREMSLKLYSLPSHLPTSMQSLPVAGQHECGKY